MKKLGLFISGFIAGGIIVFVFFYVLGHGLEYLDIQLYESAAYGDYRRIYTVTGNRLHGTTPQTRAEKIARQ